MTELSTEEPLSTISDSSFVILGQGSLPSHINNEFSSPENSQNVVIVDTQLKTSTISNSLFQSTRSDMKSFLELGSQEKLNKLLEENYNLRETLRQNNLAIKSQLDTFIMWQQEVLKTHETHKQKFIETKELILKLRSENASLKKKIEEQSQKFSLVDSSADFESLSADKKRSAEFDKLEKEIKFEDKCNDLLMANEKLIGEKYRMQAELEKTRNECMKLNKDLEDLSRENKFLTQKVHENQPESFSHASLPNTEARVQISNLFKQLEEERLKVLMLKEELKVIKLEKPVQMSKAKVTDELTEYLGKLDDMNLSLDKQNERFNSIMSWVSLVEENVVALEKQKDVDVHIKSELAQLKSHLHQEENDFKVKQENFNEMHKQFSKLLQDYKELLEKVNSIDSINSKAEKYEEELISLSEKIRIKDESLTAKQQECDILKKTVEKLKLECEEVALLKVQMQLYQADFNDERTAREKLVGEKEEMAEQIRFLQSRLEESKGEDTSRPSSLAQQSPLERKKARYVCPKCMFSFSDLDRCEKHIDECLNIHFYP